MFHEQATHFGCLHGSRKLGHVLAIATAVLALALVPLLWGFVSFVRGIHELERPVERADAIVVLSGDPERLRKAVGLLAKGYAGRLLITGPNKRIVITHLASLQPVLFASRVDIDPLPRNTIGDADAARRWVNKHGFALMIVVSSNYHMPRAMLELDTLSHTFENFLILWSAVSLDLISGWGRPPLSACWPQNTPSTSLDGCK
jgi:uncharacterized SAM-binding protein YcdF (DUF218 family)